MRIEIVLLILGMTAVTYLPRALPGVLIGRLKFGKRFQKFLRLIPYTAMAALIFPGVLYVDPANMWIVLTGAGVAAILAACRLPVMASVLGAIGVNFLLYMFV